MQKKKIIILITISILILIMLGLFIILINGSPAKLNSNAKEIATIMYKKYESIDAGIEIYYTIYIDQNNKYLYRVVENDITITGPDIKKEEVRTLPNKLSLKMINNKYASYEASYIYKRGDKNIELLSYKELEQQLYK